MFGDVEYVIDLFDNCVVFVVVVVGVVVSEVYVWNFVLVVFVVVFVVVVDCVEYGGLGLFDDE